jgi:hypothetical protein
MRTRENEIYVSNDLKRALWYVARSRGTRADLQGFMKPTTEEDVAEECLWAMIKEKYPEILDHQKEAAKKRKKLIDDLARKRTTESLAK